MLQNKFFNSRSVKYIIDWHWLTFLEIMNLYKSFWWSFYFLLEYLHLYFLQQYCTFKLEFISENFPCTCCTWSVIVKKCVTEFFVAHVSKTLSRGTTHVRTYTYVPYTCQVIITSYIVTQRKNETINNSYCSNFLFNWVLYYFNLAREISFRFYKF